MLNLWNGTFQIELVFSGEKKIKVMTHKGSLKSAIRKVLKDYKGVHVAANFYTGNRVWLKEVSM